MGQQRTGGYRMALNTDRAVVTDSAARISLLWTEPSADSIVSQALTHPCILVAIPRGGYSRIVVVDQNGQQRLEITLSP